MGGLRSCLVSAGCLAALLAVACGRPRPPDVLLISLDSVRADKLTFLDPEATPRMASLAHRGVVFSQAVAGSSWTLPSHMQMFTGLPPVLHGVQWGDVRLDAGVPTLPEVLQDAGYFTAGTWTGWFLAGAYGFERGFDTYVNAMNIGPELDRKVQEAVAREDFVAAQEALRVRNRSGHADITSQDVVRNVRQQLASLEAGRPLFLFCHFMDPHFDYIPPEPYDRRFDPDYRGSMDGSDYWSNRRIWDPSQPDPRRISERDLEHVVALYRGEIAWTDRAIGQILDQLESAGRLQSTLIIITADHGEEFFEHGQRGHRQSLLEEVLRVPLLIVPPGSPAGAQPRVCNRLVGLDDLLPTVLDYAGVDVPPSVYGRSLRPWIDGGTLPDRPQVSTLVQRARTTGGEPGFMLFEALRMPNRKLIRRVIMGEGGRPTTDGVFLFDLANDPGERWARSDPSDPRVSESWRALEEEMDSIRRAWRQLPHSPKGRRRTRVAEMFAEDLQALGYVGDVGSDTPPDDWVLTPMPPLPLPGASGP